MKKKTQKETEGNITEGSEEVLISPRGSDQFFKEK